MRLNTPDVNKFPLPTKQIIINCLPYCKVDVNIIQGQYYYAPSSYPKLWATDNSRIQYTLAFTTEASKLVGRWSLMMFRSVGKMSRLKVKPILIC